MCPRLAPILIGGLSLQLSIAHAQSADSAGSLPPSAVVLTPGSPAFLRSTPYRTLEQILSLISGVILQNGSLHMRGGRADEVHYRVSGFSATNPFTNRALFELIPEAIDGIEVRTGPADGEIARALSGDVNSVMRRGSDHFEIRGSLQTDEVVPFGHSVAGIRSYGYRDGVVTAGGPLPLKPGTTFFMAGRHRYMRDRTPAFRTPFSVLPGSVDSVKPFPAALVLDDHTFANNTQEENAVQGTLAGTFGAFTVQLTGHQSWEHSTVGSEWPSRLERHFAQARNPELKSVTGFLGITSEYGACDATTFTLGATYAWTRTRTVDPVFGETWQLYMDSAANAQAGYGGFTSRWSGPSDFISNHFLYIDDPRAPTNTFMKQSQSGWSLSAGLRHEFDTSNRLEAGGELERWTMRMYSIANISSAMFYLYGQDGNTPRVFASDIHRYWLIPREGRINNYGFDELGNIADDGLSTPFSPVIGSAYLAYRWQKGGLTLTSTLRYEYYNTDVRPLRNPNGPSTYFLPSSGPEVIPEERLADAKGYHYVLPQIRAAYTSDNGSSLTFGFGSYAQLPALDQLYLGSALAVLTISPITRGSAYQPPVGFFAGPERATQLEVSLTRPVHEQVTVGVRGYMKHMWDLLTVRYQPVQSYVCSMNRDEANAKGLEVTVRLTTQKGLSAYFAYVLSEVRGSGSHPRSTLGAVEQYADSLLTSLTRLDFNQTHRGTLLLSYATNDRVSGVFNRTGLQLQLTYNSGHNYSPRALPAYLGSSEPLMKGVDLIDDPRFADPIVPTGSAITPALFNVDLGVSKRFVLGGSELEIFVQVLNLFNTRHVLNVYPTTGNAVDDGFLGSPRSTLYAAGYAGFPEFYRAINSENRWSYLRATGKWYNREQLSGDGYDLYGTPRQFRVGLRLTVGTTGSCDAHRQSLSAWPGEWQNGKDSYKISE